MSSTFIIDIDNTICLTENSNYYNSVPIHRRITRVNALYDLGNVIIYYTARGATSGVDWTVFTGQQLNTWGCRYTHLRMNKPHYDFWIDDKAIWANEYFMGN